MKKGEVMKKLLSLMLVLSVSFVHSGARKGPSVPLADPASVPVQAVSKQGLATRFKNEFREKVFKPIRDQYRDNVYNRAQRAERRIFGKDASGTGKVIEGQKPRPGEYPSHIIEKYNSNGGHQFSIPRFNTAAYITRNVGSGVAASLQVAGRGIKSGAQRAGQGIASGARSVGNAIYNRSKSEAAQWRPRDNKKPEEGQNQAPESSISGSRPTSQISESGSVPVLKERNQTFIPNYRGKSSGIWSRVKAALGFPKKTPIQA